MMLAVNRNGLALFRSEPRGTPRRVISFIKDFLDSEYDMVRVIMSEKDEYVTDRVMAISLRRICGTSQFKRHVKARELDGMVFLIRKYN